MRGKPIESATRARRCLVNHRALVRKVRNLSCIAGELQDMHAGARTVDHINIAAIIDFHIVGLDDGFAIVLAAGWTRQECLIGDSGNVIANFFRCVRITDIHGPHTGIEVGKKYNASVVDGREAFVGRMRAKATAAAAKIAA